MFEAIRNWVVNNQRASFLIGFALFGVLALILATGTFFEVDFGRIAAQEFDRCDGVVCGFDEECDEDTGSCESISGMTPTRCVLVTAPEWIGDSSSAPYDVYSCFEDTGRFEGGGIPVPPENWEPHIGVMNIGGFPPLATTDPFGSAVGYECFGYQIIEGNPWELIDAKEGGTLPEIPDEYTMTGVYVNNCPWPVEITGKATGSPTSSNSYIFKINGIIDEPIVSRDELLTFESTTAPIPSCWNWSHIQQPFNAEMLPDCDGFYSITFNSVANAGRTEVSMAARHLDEIGTAMGNTTFQIGYTIIADTGRDCTQAPGEICAGVSASGGGGGAVVCPEDTSGTGTGPSGERSNGFWCGEWTDAVWAQRHANAGHLCSPGYVLTAEFKAFLAANVPAFSVGDGAPDGTNDGDILNWSRGEVQAFMDVMADNFSTNQACTPKSPCVDYAAIQKAYSAISTGGIGLSGNGSAAVGALCRLNIGIDPADLTATCQSGPSIRLEWNIPLGSVANGLIKRIDGGEGQFISGGIGRLTTNYTDSDVEAGHTYQYVHKAHASVASDPVDVVIDSDGTCRVLGGSPTPTPTTTPTPTPPAGTATPTPPPGAVCGDGTCSGGETCTICADDCGSCGSTCGNGTCDSNESCSSCSADCGTCSASCGDDTCGTGESCSNCADDCGTCGATCGDGICDNSESCSTCANDCGTCGQIVGQIGPAGQTPTGPAAATFLAFMLASVTALLYVSYTHTSLFRRREVQKVTDDSEGMDFRA